jgi:hypothetical protein
MAIERYREPDQNLPGGYMEYSWVPQDRIDLLKELLGKLGRKWLGPLPEEKEEARQMNLHSLQLLKDAEPFVKQVLKLAKPLEGAYAKIAKGLRENYRPDEDAHQHLVYTLDAVKVIMLGLADGRKIPAAPFQRYIGNEVRFDLWQRQITTRPHMFFPGPLGINWLSFGSEHFTWLTAYDYAAILDLDFGGHHVELEELCAITDADNQVRAERGEAQQKVPALNAANRKTLAAQEDLWHEVAAALLEDLRAHAPDNLTYVGCIRHY